MKRLLCCLMLTCLVWPAAAQDGPAPDLANNAALRYWVAFNQLPEYTRQLDALREQGGDQSILWDQIALDEARTLLEQSAPARAALSALHWGSQQADCVWAIEYSAGPYALLPHLAPARTLARLGMMSARVRLHDGDASGATDDLLAVLALSHAFDSDRLLISSLVGLSIESMMVRFAAEHLSGFDDASVARLADAMASQPGRPALSVVIAMEYDTFVGWLERALRQAEAAGDGGEAVPALLESLGMDGDRQAVEQDFEQWYAWIEEAREAYDEAGRVADLPYHALGQSMAELEAQFVASENQVVRLFIPSIAAVRHSSDRALAWRTMLLAMFAIRLDDDAADLADHPAMQDPFGEGTFELVIQRDDETGELVYGLRSALVDRGGDRVELHTDAPLGQAQP
ncbi:MAG: hypothetical protein ACIAXF_17370 [Phycisphaerales bacterium JB063]